MMKDRDAISYLQFLRDLTDRVVEDGSLEVDLFTEWKFILKDIIGKRGIQF